ncbi:hypothetical protein KDH_75780 [Dictyobacter sp. S3.2.2.5]|uniref:Pyridoxamine 5'-phosphate oxidase putative domain-containing protein n=1 Tax=Dictyobacter halimunensis TaxID=3026934 RepID=A0ABQ6G2K7_9CHLR|nr:hypothetical protein KDH_75780 [Dictyobacter sp. S3.2.2.5]
MRNLRHNPAILLALETAENGHNVVMMEGEAILPDGQVTPPIYFRKYADGFKELNWELEAIARQFSQTVRVTPIRLIHWSL